MTDDDLDELEQIAKNNSSKIDHLTELGCAIMRGRAKRGHPSTGNKHKLFPRWRNELRAYRVHRQGGHKWKTPR
jgi:hypothetical protein